MFLPIQSVTVSYWSPNRPSPKKTSQSSLVPSNKPAKFEVDLMSGCQETQKTEIYGFIRRITHEDRASFVENTS